MGGTGPLFIFYQNQQNFDRFSEARLAQQHKHCLIGSREVGKDRWKQDECCDGSSNQLMNYLDFS